MFLCPLASKARMLPVKRAPSDSNVPPPMGAVGDIKGPSLGGGGGVKTFRREWPFSLGSKSVFLNVLYWSIKELLSGGVMIF